MRSANSRIDFPALSDRKSLRESATKLTLTVMRHAKGTVQTSNKEKMNKIC